MAGQLGPATQLDATQHPPLVASVELELEGSDLGGIWARLRATRPSGEYTAVDGAAPHEMYRSLRLAPDSGSDACWTISTGSV